MMDLETSRNQTPRVTRPTKHLNLEGKVPKEAVEIPYHQSHSVITVGPLTVLNSIPTPLLSVSAVSPIPREEESASEEEKDTPASPVFTKKIQTPVFSASGNSLLTLAREAREANASSLQGMTNTLETMQKNLDRARQQTAVQSSEPGNQFILQQLEDLQKNFLNVQEQIKAQNQAQKSEENKREVQRILDRMEVKAAERRAVVRENQLKREMEAGLKEASAAEPSALSSTDEWIINELKRLQQEVGKLKDESTKTHSGTAPPWERKEESLPWKPSQFSPPWVDQQCLRHPGWSQEKEQQGGPIN